MKFPQYKDGKKGWVNIPTIGIPDNPEVLAYEYCRQHGLSTRVVDIEGKETKTLKEFRRQKRGQ